MVLVIIKPPILCLDSQCRSLCGLLPRHLISGRSSVSCELELFRLSSLLALDLALHASVGHVHGVYRLKLLCMKMLR